MVKNILKLGNEELYLKSENVKYEELSQIEGIVENLHDTLIDFRKRYGVGRAIAAPQIGVKKRVLYMNTGESIVFINPVIEFSDNDKMEVLDDCMSFPNLYVKVLRYKRCIVRFKDVHWKECELHFEGDLSELIQHEYDHLDGILATMRAMDEKAFVLKGV